MFKNILILLSVSIIILGSCISENEKSAQSQKPNIIVIYTDDQRYEALGASGNPIIHTPALNKLSEHGIKFRNANVVFSLCSPSRAALLTGRYGSANGVLDLGSDLNQDEKTLASYLREAGYITGTSGKWHIKRRPKELGFDFYSYFLSNGTYYGRKIFDMDTVVYPENHCDDYCANRSIDFIREQAESGKPFFLFHCTQTPHMDHRHTWPSGDSTRSLYTQEEMPVPSNRLDDLSNKPKYLKVVRNLKQAKKYGYPDSTAIQSHTLDYYSVITEMDFFLGNLLSEVEKLGLKDNTYIFYMSDNGWMIGDHGFTSKVLPYRPSTRVPFAAVGPGIKSGENEGIVLNIDITPTIMEIAKVDIPENIHGKSIFPILTGETTKVREAFVYEGLGMYGGAKPNLTVISPEFRYIITYSDKTLSKVIFEELYDQKNDPSEMNNLMNNDNYKEIINSLKKELELYKETVAL